MLAGNPDFFSDHFLLFIRDSNRRAALDSNGAEETRAD